MHETLGHVVQAGEVSACEGAWLGACLGGLIRGVVRGLVRDME